MYLAYSQIERDMTCQFENYQLFPIVQYFKNVAETTIILRCLRLTLKGLLKLNVWLEFRLTHGQ